MNIISIFIRFILRNINKYILIIMVGLMILLDIDCASQNAQQPVQSRIPPNQIVITDFPNLYIAQIPELTRENWTLRITGEVQDTVILDWNAFSHLDTLSIISDFHCVTGWSRLDNHWTGVLLRDVIALAHPKESARYITFIAADEYTTFLPISECTGNHDLLAFRWEGKDLDAELGGPVRVVVPKKYGYKNTKWLMEMRLTKKPEDGYWESRGYSRTADPWKEERTQ